MHQTTPSVAQQEHSPLNSLQQQQTPPSRSQQDLRGNDKAQQGPTRPGTAQARPARSGPAQAGSSGQSVSTHPGSAQTGETTPEPAAAAPGSSVLTRVTVNLTRPAVQALESVSEATGYSKTDTINRALQVYAIVQEIMSRNGGVLTIRHDDGGLERIHIV